MDMTCPSSIYSSQTWFRFSPTFRRSMVSLSSDQSELSPSWTAFVAACLAFMSRSSQSTVQSRISTRKRRKRILISNCTPLRRKQRRNVTCSKAWRMAPTGTKTIMTPRSKAAMTLRRMKKSVRTAKPRGVLSSVASLCLQRGMKLRKRFRKWRKKKSKKSRSWTRSRRGLNSWLVNVMS